MTASRHFPSRPTLRVSEPNTAGRDFAVGDIHGWFSELEQALQAVRFDAARDRLFALGDLVDRGPESARMLDWLEKPWFHAVRGNHEVMACAALLGSADDMAFHIRHGGAWLHELDEATQARCARAMQALPLAIEVPTASGPVALVHADLPTDDWQDLRQSLLAGRLTPREASHCVWSIERYRHRYAAPVRGARAVAHGHITLPRPLTLGNVHYIDTKGGYADKRYTLLTLNAPVLQSFIWPD